MYPIFPLTLTWETPYNYESRVNGTRYKSGVDRRDRIGINLISEEIDARVTVGVDQYDRLETFLATRRGRPFRLRSENLLLDSSDNLYVCSEWSWQQIGFSAVQLTTKLQQVRVLGQIRSLMTQIEQILELLDGKADRTHTHTIEQVEDLNTILSTLQLGLDSLETALVQGLNSKVDQTDFDTHGHQISDVSGLALALDSKLDRSEYQGGNSGDINAAITDHVGQPNPHPQYATDTDVAALVTIVGNKLDRSEFDPQSFASDQDLALLQDDIDEVGTQFDRTSHIYNTRARFTTVPTVAQLQAIGIDALTDEGTNGTFLFRGQASGRSNVVFVDVNSEQSGVYHLRRDSANALSVQRPAGLRSPRTGDLIHVDPSDPNAAGIYYQAEQAGNSVKFFRRDSSSVDSSQFGTMATQNANNVNITGGLIEGLRSLGTRSVWITNPFTEQFSLIAEAQGQSFVVDGFANVFASGRTRVTNSTPSTSSTTGALVVSGGIGVGGAGHFAGDVFSGGVNLRSAIAGLGTLAQQNANNVNITGGRIQGLSLLSTRFLYMNSPESTEGFPVNLELVSPNAFSIDGFANILTTGRIRTTNNTPTTSTTTGAIVASGGLGISGNGHFGGDVFSAGVNLRSAISDLQNNALEASDIGSIVQGYTPILQGFGAITITPFDNGTFPYFTAQGWQLKKIAESDIPALDAFKIQSGRFGSARIPWSQPEAIGANTPNTGRFTTLQLTGGNSATNTTSGDLQISGGMSALGNAHFGGKIYSEGVNIDAPNLCRKLFVRNTATVVTSTTDETTIASFVIPANTLNLNSCLLFDLLAGFTSNGNQKTIRIRIGSTVVWLYQFTNNHQGFQKQFTLRNENSMNSQVMINLGLNSYSSSTSGFTNTQIDFTQNQTVTVTFQNAVASDVATLRGFSVFHY